MSKTLLSSICMGLLLCGSFHTIKPMLRGDDATDEMLPLMRQVREMDVVWRCALCQRGVSRDVESHTVIIPPCGVSVHRVCAIGWYGTNNNLTTEACVHCQKRHTLGQDLCDAIKVNDEHFFLFACSLDGAHLNQKDMRDNAHQHNYKATPLHYVVFYQRPRMLIRLLGCVQLDKSIRDEWGRTAATLAHDAHDYDVEQRILSKSLHVGRAREKPECCAALIAALCRR